MKHITTKEEDGVTMVVITEEIQQTPKTVVKEIPYQTLVNHIVKIDESITRLEEEKVEYQEMIDKADIEIAK